MEIRSEADARLGRRLRGHREAKGLTQADVARQLRDYGLRLHASAIAKIEAGGRAVRLSEAVVIANWMGTTVDSLTEHPGGELTHALEGIQEALKMHTDAADMGLAALNEYISIASAENPEAWFAALHPSRSLYLAEMLLELERYDPRVREVIDGPRGAGLRRYLESLSRFASASEGEGSGPLEDDHSHSLGDDDGVDQEAP